jgi:GPH family glycoside/pentoside/hexuronide:cation symporter
MEQFKGIRLFLYNLSTMGHALFDRISVFFLVPFLIPSKERIAEGMIQFLSDQTYLYFFTVVGVIMLFGRIVDAVSDPLVAYLSDRSKAKIGRRKIFMIFGGVPLALSTVLIFFPPVPSPSVINAVYLAGVIGLFYLAYTIYVAPYIALIPELGHTEKARLNITTVQGYFALAGGAVVMIAGPNLLGIFEKTVGPAASYQYTMVIFGILGVILLYSAVFAVNEKKYSSAQPSTVPLVKSFKMTIKNRPFIIFLIADLAFWFVFNIISASVIPIGETLMRVSTEEAGFNLILLFVVAGLCFILVNILSKKIGIKPVLVIGLTSFALLAVLIAITGFIPCDPKIWGLAVFALFGFPVSILLTIPNVFISELCDYDFRLSGERREAMYFGVHGFFLKFNIGISSFVLAFLYLFFGKDVANPLGIRLSAIAGSIVAIIGMLIFLRYPSKLVKGEVKAN